MTLYECLDQFGDEIQTLYKYLFEDEMLVTHMCGHFGDEMQAHSLYLQATLGMKL